MAGVRLRPWRISDITAVAVMAEDEYLRPWWAMSADPVGWMQREVAEERGPSRAICLADDDRALGRVALRLDNSRSDAVGREAVRGSDRPAGELSYSLVPEARGRGLAFSAVRIMLQSVVIPTGLRSVVLDIEVSNSASIRLAERLGAQRRGSPRIEKDRFGVPRSLVIYVLSLNPL